MSDALDVLLVRHADARAAWQADAHARVTAPASRVQIGGSTFRPGERVFDSVTGEDVEVIHASLYTVAVPSA